MDSDQGRVSFRYEGAETINGRTSPLWCVYEYQGKEYRVRYSTIMGMVDVIHVFPEPVRKSIIHWVGMIHNPD